MATHNRRPPNAGKGRPKGAVNKTTAAFKTALVESFEANGGVPWLTDWGKKNPTDFFKLMGKLIPIQVDAAIQHGKRADELSDDELAAIATGGG